MELIEKLIQEGNSTTLEDALTLAKSLADQGIVEILGTKGQVLERIRDSANVKKALGYSERICEGALKLLRSGRGDADVEALYWNSLLFAAPYSFDAYCQYIEKNREPDKRFYAPRRKQLRPLAEALQRLENDDLDLLALSLPPGVGKTTLAIFYITWTSGLHPELQSLIGSHNNEFLRGVYEECLRIFDPHGEYLWCDVFPGIGVSGTNAKDMRIDLGQRKRFQTIELTSLGAGNAGKVRATNMLYCDDLVEGIEQAMSRDQMDKLWSKYTVDLRQRKQGDRVKELHIATRWSLADVIGRLQDIYAGSDRAEFINVPALDENGESNFEYPYGVGFTAEMYRDLQASMDDASFRALYLGEPIEREGQLYAPSELRRYFELPEREPDAIIAVCDTKEQGDDYCVMPVVYQYGTDMYVDRFICDNGKPDVIQQRLVNALIMYGVQMVRFESNRGGSIFAENVQTKLKERGSHCRVTTKWNQTNKETRMLVASGWVKENCLFLDESLYKQDREYAVAMQFLTGYTMSGKNKHDDVPDAMADLENFVKMSISTKVETIKRAF